MMGTSSQNKLLADNKLFIKISDATGPLHIDKQEQQHIDSVISKSYRLL